jgi:hypothetical protein
MFMSFPSSPKSFVFMALILAGVGAGAWGVVHYSGKTTQVADGPQIPDEYSLEKIKAAMKEDPTSRRDKMREFWERKDLTDEQREKIGDNLRQVMEEEQDTRINDYFSASPEDREKILDKQIDEMEQRRKEFEARRAEEEKKERTEEDEKEREKRREEWRKRAANQTPAQRQAATEGRNPDKSAKRMEYMAAMQKRMAARGIQPPRFGPGGGRGGPGGGGPRRGPGG